MIQANEQLIAGIVCRFCFRDKKQRRRGLPLTLVMISCILHLGLRSKVDALEQQLLSARAANNFVAASKVEEELVVQQEVLAAVRYLIHTFVQANTTAGHTHGTSIVSTTPKRLRI